MSDESLWALADWLHAVVDTTWTVYTLLAVAFVAVLVIAVIAEILHLSRRER